MSVQPGRAARERGREPPARFDGNDGIESAVGLAYEVGRYALSGQVGDIDHGKYIVVWKKVGGQWKLHRDIFNSDVAPPSAGGA